jgi:hypothetical protein
MNIELTEAQQQLANQYALKNAELKKLTDEVKKIREQLDIQLAIDAFDSNDKLLIETSIANFTYSSNSKKRQFNSNIRDFIADTDAYEARSLVSLGPGTFTY